MPLIDNTLAAQVPTYDAAAPLQQAAQIQAQQQANQAAQYKQIQTEIGSEARGLTPFVNTPEFPAKWAEMTDRLAAKGLINPQLHDQWRNTPSPLLHKQMIAQTEDPTLSFRKDEAAREQGNTNRSFDLQKTNSDRNYGLAVRAADRADEDKFSLQKVESPDGSSKIVRIKTTGPEGVVDTGIAPQQPNNPFSVGPKLTQDQSKSATMVDRMSQANGVLDKNKDINNDFFGYLGGVAAAIPKVRDSAVFNAVASPERQQVMQAQRNFVNAILRVESGAAISQSEFDNAQRQYFPQPGDSKEVIGQKRENRVTAMQGMAREAGPNYKPPADLVATTKPPASQGKAGDAIYQQARDAIAKGADRNKVLERMKQNGIDPSGL